MNVLAVALSQVQNLVTNQRAVIEKQSSIIDKGVARPVFEEVEIVAHFQPMTAQEVKAVDDGVFSAEAYYRVWIIGDRLDLVLSALNQNKHAVIVWNGKRYSVFSKMDWSLNGWIECLIALRGSE